MFKRFFMPRALIMLLLPLYAHENKAEVENPVGIAIAAAGGLLAGGSAAYFWLTWHKHDKKLIKQTQKLCDTIEFQYKEELELINKYETTRYSKNPSCFNSTAQENLRRDILERALGRETTNQTEKPLHFQEQTLNIVVIRNINQKIEALLTEIKLIDKKLSHVMTTTERTKLLAQKEKLIELKDRCEVLKKKAETIRGAIMMSKHYKHESKINSNEPKVKPRPDLGSAPHPSQQQKMHHDAQKNNR